MAALWWRVLIDGIMMTRRYNHFGEPLGDPQTVSTIATDVSVETKQVTLTELNDGRYVVGWASSAAQDGDAYSAMARVFAIDGTALTSEIVLNEFGAGNQNAVRLAPVSNGGFIAVWQSFGADNDSWGVMARQFDADGQAITAEFRATSQWQSVQYQPAVTALSDGRIAIAYADRFAGYYNINVSMITPGTGNADILQGDAGHNILLGNGGNNTLHGEGGDDQLFDGTLAFGGEGDDIFYGGHTLNGDAGNDTFFGGVIVNGGTGFDDITIGSGDSTVDGGDDFDTVFFSGNLADYSVTDNGNGNFTVIDNRIDSPEGTNTLTNIEAIEFANDRRTLDTSSTPLLLWDQLLWDQLVQTNLDSTSTIDLNGGTITNEPTHGTLVFNGDTYTYTPAIGYVGIDTFTYTVSGQTYTVRIEVGLAGNSSSIATQYRGQQQQTPQLTGLSNGDYVVVWNDHTSSRSTIYYQRFSAQNVALTSALPVYFASSNSHQYSADVKATR